MTLTLLACRRQILMFKTVPRTERTHNIGIEMKGKELTKTMTMMFLNSEKKFSLPGLYKNI